MGDAEIPKELPKCELIRVLAKKISQRDDLDFYPLGRLDEFRQRVSGEVRQINELFPEYTPHDEQYHLKRLFYVADTVLGKALINEMNAAELFVLSVALYGHDWGMAVNEIEKNYIIYGTLPKDVKPEDLWILPDERNRFNSFVRDQQLIDKDNKIKEIPVEKWREYVRQTHAFRSGTRIRKFFEPIDGGVADAASRVCIGHWLDFEELQDHDSYPINYSVMREEVNLRALAVYLRLIDLLDLAEDRTPYVIWKFVAPRNTRSKMAWDKHRALRAVTCPRYQDGRVIRVDGSTDNHEVYAALEDLRIWCEKQFKGCNDILARMNDSRHKLDIYHIDWHVEARGFKKTSIGFQFDRERMFEILGNEIYQGDPYVFLRELLQNSIDAIRMRREILRKHAKIEPGNLGVIRVNVEHLDNKDIIVTWSDDGIGMDEYIIQNYLAVVGKSYYRSPDFEKVGLEMDPISRFGIGILSCFIVANQIEIETYRDPHLLPRSEPLKITIPDQSKQFRVETLPDGCAEIGTTIRVFVESKKISNCDKNNPIDSLEVTKYLSIIAGFVEFPIIIDEYDQKTIILHPRHDGVAIEQRFGEDYRLQKLNLSYPWSEAILPQDLATAHELLREERFDLRSDLGVDGIEGILAYLVPINDDIDINPYSNKVLIRGQSRIFKDKLIRGNQNWSNFSEEDDVGLSRSSKHRTSYSVYKDGILVPNASYPQIYREGFEGLQKPLLLVNLSTKKGPTVDVSRTDFSVGSGFWDTHIYQSHIKKISDDNLGKLLSLNPLDRLYQMGCIAAFHKIDPLELWNVFPHKHWPIAFLQSGGHIEAFEFGDISGRQIKLFPDTLIEDGELSQLIVREYTTKDEPKGPLEKWKGDPVIIKDYDQSSSIRGGIALHFALNICEVPIKEYYYEDFVTFSNPPWDGDPPLIQRVLLPKDNTKEPIEISNLLEKAVRNPSLISSFELSLLCDEFVYHGDIDIKFINFSKPFDQLFAYGTSILNIKHPAAKELLQFICILLLSKEHKSLSRELGKLDDSISSFYDIDASNLLAMEKENVVTNALKYIWQIAKEIKFDSGGIDEQVIPGPEDFVPGTIIDPDDKKGIQKIFEIDYSNPFGEPL